MKRKLRSRVIDGEGIETEEKKLIDNGFLKFFFNCLSTAKQIKEDPSGHGTRYVSSIPSASYTNLYLKNGKKKKKDMISSLKKGLIITELMGSSLIYQMVIIAEEHQVFGLKMDKYHTQYLK